MCAKSDSLAKVKRGALKGEGAPVAVHELERGLFELFGREQAESWDRPGLLCGDAAAEVKGVAVALDPTLDAVSRTEELGYNVLLTHHPLFLEPPGDVCTPGSARDFSGSIVFEAVSAKVSCIAMHTNLDKSPQANCLITAMLGLKATGPLVPTEPTGWGYGQIGVLEGEKMSLAQLSARCMSVFGRAPRVYGEQDRKVDVVACSSGSGSSFISDALSAHAQVFVTGEIGYHKALEAVQRGLCIIELGHDVSELPHCGVLAKAARKLGVAEGRITMLDQRGNWHTPEAIRV